MIEWPFFTVRELQDAGVLYVVDGNHGQDRPRPDEFVAEGTAFIRASDLEDGRVQFDQASRISEVALQRIRKGFGAPGDVLFSHKGTVGKLARAPMNSPPFVCSPQTTLWRVTDEWRLRRDWLYAYMRSRPFIDQWWVRKGETDMADYVSLTAQRQLKVLLPPIDIQARLAAPLAAIDDLIDNNRRRIEVLEEMARAVYQEWFVRFRYPGHEDVPLVDSPLGPIPDGWRVAPLDLVAAVNRRSRTPSPDEVIRYLDISALGDRTVGSLGALRGINAPGRARRVVEAGDVVWSMVRPNRRAHALLIDPGPDWIASTGLAVLSATEVSSTWLFETTSTQEFSDYLVSQEGGAAYPAVKPKDFERTRLVIPPSDIDRRFADWVGPMHQLSWSFRERSVVLGALRDILLPKLVTGRIDLSRLDLPAQTEAAIA